MESKDAILERVGKQLSSPVLWNECVAKAVNLGVNEFVEIGPKPVLSALLKSSSKSIAVKFLLLFSLLPVERYAMKRI